LAHPAEGAPTRRHPVGSVLQRSESHTPNPAKRQALLWFGLLLALALTLRIYRLGQNSLWVDEYASLVTAGFPLADIPAAALRDDAFEPPLYFWLLHLVTGFFGDSESAIRLLSAVAGAVTVLLTALLVRALGESTSVASLSAVLLALSPLHLWYSQEGRPYALLVGLGIGSLVSLLRALRTGAALAWVGFAVLASLAILTHVVGLVFPLIGWLWAIRARRAASVLRPLFAATIVIVLAIAPFGYRLAQAVVEAQGTGSPPRPLTGLEIPYTMFTYVGGYSFGPSVREIQDEGASAAVLGHPNQSALGVVAVLAFMGLVLRLRSKAAMNLALLTLLPVTITWVGAALTGKAYNVRYTLPGIIGFLGLIALGISGLPKTRRATATALVAALFLWADAQWFFNPRYWKEDSRTAVAWLKDKLPAGSTVAVAPGYQANVVTYYAGREGVNLVFVGLPDSASFIESAPPDALLITRLHHVPHWRELVRSFQSRTESPPRPVKLVGYRAFLTRR
jgi:hypothetical protein